MKRVAFSVAAGAIGLLALEGAARLVVPVVASQMQLDARPAKLVLADQANRTRVMLAAQGSRTILDTLVGWRYRPGYRSDRDTTNSAGMRASREYAAQRPDTVLRVAAFGDSFVYSVDVSNNESWSHLVEQQYPGLEILNYGVGGYGTDQAFLLFLREGMRYSPDYVLIGFAPVNLRRVVSVYRRFLSTDEYPLAKPRFALLGDTALRLLPNPLPHREDIMRLSATPDVVLRELGASDAWYDAARYEFTALDWSASFRLARAVGMASWRKCCWSERPLHDGQFRVESEAYRVQLALLKAFADSVRARGAKPIIVFFPDRDSAVWLAESSRAVYAPLRDALERDSVAPVVDLWHAFAALPSERRSEALIASGGHYSAAGDSTIADWIGRYLNAARMPLPAPAIK